MVKNSNNNLYYHLKNLLNFINIKPLYTINYILYIYISITFRFIELFIKKKRKYEYVYINSLSFDIYYENR